MYWVSSSNLSSFILNARVFIFVQLPSLTAFAEIEDIGVSVAYAIYLQYFGVRQVLILLSVIDIRQSVGRHYRTKGIPLVHIQSSFQNRKLVIRVYGDEL